MQGERVCEDGALVVIVENDLIRSPWRCGDEIVVQNKHALETSDPNDMTFALCQFVSLLAALGSVKDAAMVWRELENCFGVKRQSRGHFSCCDNIIEREDECEGVVQGG